MVERHSYREATVDLRLGEGPNPTKGDDKRAEGANSRLGRNEMRRL